MKYISDMVNVPYIDGIQLMSLIRVPRKEETLFLQDGQ
jgi:hypothetical protein